MKVIINADDLGKSLAVNCAIEDCIKKGLITSSTIMAGGEAFDDAVRIAKSYPQISFGVHLTIDDGDMSLTRTSIFVNEGITDSDGKFIRYGIKEVKTYSRELREAIYNEWTAQIQKVKNAGINISHVDSHHHNHTILPLRNTLVKVLKDNDIHCVRLNQAKTPSMYLHHISIVHPVAKPKLAAKVQKTNIRRVSRMNIAVNILKYFMWAAKIRSNFKTTDYFCSFATFLKNREALCSFFKNGIIELMCHPGHPDYVGETDDLKMLPKDIIKINYSNL